MSPISARGTTLRRWNHSLPVELLSSPKLLLSAEEIRSGASGVDGGCVIGRRKYWDRLRLRRRTRVLLSRVVDWIEGEEEGMSERQTATVEEAVGRVEETAVKGRDNW